MIHFLFNVVGSAVSFVILLFALTPITDAIMHMSGNDPARAVANVHTIMKVFEVAILFPFMGWIVKATYKVVPGGMKNRVMNLSFTISEEKHYFPNNSCS